MNINIFEKLMNVRSKESEDKEIMRKTSIANKEKEKKKIDKKNVQLKIKTNKKSVKDMVKYFSKNGMTKRVEKNDDE